MVKRYAIRAAWDAEGGVWWGHNAALPLTTEAATLDELLTRVLAIAPQIAVENGLAAIGDEIVIQLVAERAVIVAV
jgi:Domain of unknown function (DUF1902)